MLIKGLRIHITGSANTSIDSNILRYAHELVAELVKTLLIEGAMFITGVGKEPLLIPNDCNSLPIIFDWTTLSAIHDCLQQGLISTFDFSERLVYTTGTSKTESQIPDSRRKLWESLQDKDAVEINFLKVGLASAALRRERQAPRGDILIIIGGGEGVEHLASLYMENGKPVIPLDLQIGSSCNDGSGGGSRLAMEMRGEPNRFVHISDVSTVGSLVSGLTTRQGKRPVKEVVRGIVKLIQALESVTKEEDKQEHLQKELEKEREKPKYEKEIFISYAWGGDSETYVNRLDAVLQSKGISIIRDKRDLAYKGLIKAFMEKIGRGKCVIAVISDKYLKSPNCMFELVQIANNGEFYNRIFPIVLADAQIYNPIQRIKYIKHWEDQIKELDEAIKGVSAANLQGFREEIDLYTKIRHIIAELTNLLKNMNTLTPDIHEESDFEELSKAIARRLDE
ncbi:MULTISPECIES: TIR domain-containing protein [Nostoc]|nr:MULTISPECIES: TIR domain-containing protein [Nostoc]